MLFFLLGMEENKLLQKFFGLELHTLSKISVRRKAGDEGFFFQFLLLHSSKKPILASFICLRTSWTTGRSLS